MIRSGDIVALAGALPMEVAGIARLGKFRKERLAGIEFWQGGVRGTGVALIVSGMGEERAYEAARALCSALPVRAYVSIGLSGSLNPELKPGDVVISERVRTIASKGFGEYVSDPGLLTAARGAFKPGEAPVTGLLLAGGRVVVSSAEKKRLAGSLECHAIDMETAGAARAALNAGVPFLAIRAISDGIDEDLPVDFNRFATVDGTLDWPALIFHVLTHPGKIRPLVRLGRNSRLAVDNLTRVVERMLGVLP